jgi:hypothetical protein
MSEAIVERLRNVGRDYDFHENALIYEAAGKIERLLEHIAQQQLDIVTLGQEVGRLREAMEKIAYLESSQVRGKPRRTTVEEIARAALGEEKK